MQIIKVKVLYWTWYLQISQTKFADTFINLINESYSLIVFWGPHKYFKNAMCVFRV